MVEIIFKNRTKKIEQATVIIDGKQWIFKGDKAREIAKMSNSDNPQLRIFIESMFSNT